jgi:putative endonuclease
MHSTITTTQAKRTGIHGEQLAQQYLQANRYTVYKTNVRIKYDEIDIIAYDHTDNVLVFVEVKTRSKATSFFNPMLNITYKKKRAMFRAARTFVAQQDYSGAYRIDVIGVVAGRVTEHVVELSAE